MSKKKQGTRLSLIYSVRPTNSAPKNMLKNSVPSLKNNAQGTTGFCVTQAPRMHTEWRNRMAIEWRNRMAQSNGNRTALAQIE